MSSILIRHLNFLDEQRDGPRVAFAFNYLALIIILVVFLGAGVGYFQYQKVKIEKMRQEIELASQEVQALRDAEQSRNSALSSQALKSILNNPILWSGVMHDIIEKVPSAVKITQISGTIKDKRTLLIKGNSSFMSPIYQLKNNLASVKGCKDTNIVSLEQSPQNVSGKQYTFHLECTLT